MRITVMMLVILQVSLDGLCELASCVRAPSQISNSACPLVAAITRSSASVVPGLPGNPWPRSQRRRSPACQLQVPRSHCPFWRGCLWSASGESRLGRTQDTDGCHLHDVSSSWSTTAVGLHCSSTLKMSGPGPCETWPWNMRSRASRSSPHDTIVASHAKMMCIKRSNRQAGLVERGRQVSAAFSLP